MTNLKSATLAAALLAAFSAPALAGTTFPPDIRGTYSHTSSCQSDFLLTIKKDSAFLKNGGEEITMPNWDVCLSCAGGASYQGISVMSFPKLGIDLDPLFTFNADEQPGKLVIEYHGKQSLGLSLNALLAASPMQKCQ